MSKHVPVIEAEFKALLAHAEKYKIMFGGIQWYGAPIASGLQQSNLLHGEMFYSAGDFLDAVREMQIYCIRHPNDHGLDHALIYVFDGREERPKFHQYMWKPRMGHLMERVDFRQAVPDDFYARHAFDALMSQRKPVKVSTVISAALKRVHRDMGKDGADQFHRTDLRLAVATFINTNPLVHSKSVYSPKNPHGGYTMVEHLGIYDREPKWLK